MFGYKYKFKMDPTKEIITLKPTMGTYAKAFGPVVVFWALIGVLAGVQARQDKKYDETVNTLDEE